MENDDQYEKIKNSIIYIIDNSKKENRSINEMLEMLAITCWIRSKEGDLKI